MGGIVRSAMPKPRKRKVQFPHHSYQLSKAELRQEHRVDASFEEVAAACLRPEQVTYVKPQKHKP